MFEISPQYLAGLIDGEGYIALLPVRSKQVKNPAFEPVIKIGMTGLSSYAIFLKIQSKYGGHIDESNKPSTGGRVVYTYVLKSKKKVKVLLDDVSKYLWVKLPQALLLREFCDMASSHTRYKTYDNDVVLRKSEIYDLLKELKQPAAETK